VKTRASYACAIAPKSDLRKIILRYCTVLYYPPPPPLYTKLRLESRRAPRQRQGLLPDTCLSWYSRDLVGQAAVAAAAAAAAAAHAGLPVGHFAGTQAGSRNLAGILFTAPLYDAYTFLHKYFSDEPRSVMGVNELRGPAAKGCQTVSIPLSKVLGEALKPEYA
jgi:hypothetical protein